MSNGVKGPNSASGSTVATALTMAMQASAASRSPSTSLNTAFAGVSSISMRRPPGERDESGLIQPGTAGFPGGVFLGFLLMIRSAALHAPHPTPASFDGSAAISRDSAYRNGYY